MMDLTNILEPPQSTTTGYLTGVRFGPDLTSEQRTQEYNGWLTALQSRAATSQGVAAYQSAVQTSNYQYMIMQNDMILSQLKVISANTASIKVGIETLNNNIVPGSSTGEAGTITVTIPQELISYTKIGMFTSVGICACLLFMILLKAIHARHPF